MGPGVEDADESLALTRLGIEAYEAIYRHSLDAVMFTVPDGRILAANPAACELLGLSEDEILRRGRQGLVDPTDNRWAGAVAERSQRGHVRAELRFRRADGTTFVGDLSSAVFTTAGGEERACVIFRDVTERATLIARQQRLVEELERLSLVDELTGLRNRRGLLLAAQQVVAMADRQDTAVTVLFLDVDNMKAINDTRGHDAGDRALVNVANAIRRSTRGSDVAARLGGDEFVIAILGESSDGLLVRRRILSELRRGHGEPGITVSIGIASREPSGRDPIEDVLQAADREMYEARARRRSAVHGGE